MCSFVDDIGSGYYSILMIGRLRDKYQKFKNGDQKQKIKTIKKHQDERKKTCYSNFLRRK